MKFNLENNFILLFCFLATLLGCNGLNNTDNLVESEKIIRFGKVVTGIEGGINIIFQDKKDNFWFAGNNQGLYQYDGKDLVLFTTKNGLSSHSILGIQEDHLGNIYFDTTDGVSKYDGQKFTTLEVINENSPNLEWKLEAHDLWFKMGWNNDGPYRFDGEFLHYLELPKTNQETEFYSKYPNVSFNPYGIYTIYKDSKGVLWFGTSSLGICRYDGKNFSWLYEKQWTDTPSGGSFGIRSIIEDKTGHFWFCNTQYHYEILPNDSETNGMQKANYIRKNGLGKSSVENEDEFPYFMSSEKDDNGDLWMATYDDGVWHNNGKELIHYPIKNKDKEVLLFSIYKDNHGSLWLGAQNDGVYKFNGSNFEKFKM